MVWDPFGTIGNALWIGGAQWAGKSTVANCWRPATGSPPTTTTITTADTITRFPVRFEWALEDLRPRVSGRPILAEGWGLRPDLVGPLLDSPRRMVVMVPTEEFRKRQLRDVPRAGRFGPGVSDPERAQRNRIDRDRLVGEDAVWPLKPSFASDLFAGTAEYYARYRLPYPGTLIEDLVGRAGLTGERRLLDLPSRTGEVALALRPSSTAAASGTAPRHHGVLEQAGYVDMAEYDFPTPHTWTLDAVVGYLYSTSVVARRVLDTSADRFEDDLRRTLLAHDPSGLSYSSSS
jgi:hypothetical protein